MIFINNSPIIILKIPRNWAYPTNNVTIEVQNRLTNKKFIYNNVLSDETEMLYYVKIINNDEIENGEYEYTLIDKTNDIILSKGLIQIGPREINRLEYNGTNKYIEYK